MKKLLFALMIGMFLISFASADLFSGIVDYYKFDTATGYNDTLGATNLTLLGGTPVISSGGLINQQLNLTIGQIYSTDKVIFNFPINTTLNFWIKQEKNPTANEVILYKSDAGATQGWYLRHPGGGGAGIVFGNFLASGDAVIGTTSSTYKMISVIRNDTALGIYIDSVLSGSGAAAASFDGTGNKLIFGNGLTNFVNGTYQYDEMGWWNRSLNSSEITQLYNSGAGTPFTAAATPLAVSTTLNSPANSSNFASTITFNASVTPTYGNITNATLWIWNSTGGIINQTTNTLLGSSLNSTTWNVNNFSIGNYKWNVYGCAANSTGSLCAFNNENRTFVYGIGNVNTTQESALRQFRDTYFNISFNILQGNNPTGNLWWNGTAYPITFNYYNSTNWYSNYTFSPPAISGNVNTFWEINTGGLNYNTTNVVQSISSGVPIVGGNNTCAAGFNASLFYGLFTESSILPLNGTWNYNIQYGYSNNTAYLISGTIPSAQNFYVCINTTEQSYSVGYGELAYSSPGYSDRKYYIFANTRLTSTLVNNSLYSLENGNSTSFLFTVQDYAINPAVGYYVAAMRWYPNLNQYNIVDMGRTDDKGQTILKFKTEDIDYRFGVYNAQGTLVKLFTPVRMICQTNPCTYSLFLDALSSNYFDVLQMTNNLTWNNNTKTFTYVWSDPSQTTSSINLTVYKESGTTTTAVCSKQATGYVGILMCDVSAYSGTLKAAVVRTASPGKVISSLIVTIGSYINSIDDNLGLWLALIATIFMALVGMAINPILGVVFGIVGLLIGAVMGAFGEYSYEIIGGFVAIGIAIIVMMRRSG